MAYLVFRQLLVMVLICLVGFLLARWKHFDGRESQFLSYLLLYIVVPCVCIDAYNMSFDRDEFSYVLIMLGLSLLLFLLVILFSSLLFRTPKSKEDDKRCSIDKMILVYSNAGYIGIPIINATLGESAVFYLTAFLLIFNSVLWIHGQYLMTHTITPRVIFTKPAVLGCIFSLILFISPWKLPYVAGNTVHLFASLNTPLSMLVLGIVFSEFHMHKEQLPVKHLVEVTLFRLFGVPMLVLFLLFLGRPFFSSTPTLQTLSLILLVVSACPAGMTATNFALLYKKDYDYASLVIAITTVLCVVTLPICTALGEKVLFH